MRHPRWRQQGVEPDYRFSLANERTFLAWIRTGLALLAGGVLLHQFSTELTPHVVVLGLAVLLDAMLVRLVLVPTLLRVFGRHAWALPAWLDRLLPDIRFGHA